MVVRGTKRRYTCAHLEEQMSASRPVPGQWTSLPYLADSMSALRISSETEVAPSFIIALAR